MLMKMSEILIDKSKVDVAEYMIFLYFTIGASETDSLFLETISLLFEKVQVEVKHIKSVFKFVVENNHLYV